MIKVVNIVAILIIPISFRPPFSAARTDRNHNTMDQPGDYQLIATTTPEPAKKELALPDPGRDAVQGGGRSRRCG